MYVYTIVINYNNIVINNFNYQKLKRTVVMYLIGIIKTKTSKYLLADSNTRLSGFLYLLVKLQIDRTIKNRLRFDFICPRSYKGSK